MYDCKKLMACLSEQQGTFDNKDMFHISITTSI